MSPPPVPLIRQFLPIPAAYQADDVAMEDVWVGLFGSDRRNWRDLSAEYRVVVLADAGAGKTYEFRSEAQRLRAAHRTAFFIRIEDISDQFVDAFEVGDAAAFEQWLLGEEEAWFFLDSVDEVRLEAPRAFEAAIERFASRIQSARHRAHVYVSSRPYAWRTKQDREVMLRHLPFAPIVSEPVPEQDGGGDTEDVSPWGADEAPEEVEAPADPGPALYRLAPLTDDDIRGFAGHRGVGDADAFLQSVERARLEDYARRPFDLEDLLATWSRGTPLDDRLAVLQGSIARSLSPPIRGLIRPRLTLDQALSGARRLALAVVLTGQANVLMPGSEAETGLKAEEVLDGWSVPDLEALLSLGVFNDPIYRAVRFRHREVRELLAAEALSDLLKAGTRSTVEGLIFRIQYGEAVMAPRMRPLVPWMLLFDDAIRDRALQMHPEIATEGGDARQLPVGLRRNILTDMVAKITDPDLRGTGGDNAAVARIAQADLEDDVLALLDTSADSNDAIFFLGRLIWQGRMTRAAARLGPIALDPNRGPYARIVSVRAVASSGDKARSELWSALNGLGAALPRRLLAELLEDAPANDATVGLVLTSLSRLEPPTSYEASGLTRALHDYVDRLPVNGARAATQPLATLVEGLAARLGAAPHVDHLAVAISKTERWLMPIAAHAVERLTTGRADQTLEEASLSTIVNSAALRRWRDEEGPGRENRLSTLVPRWTALNDAVFWWSVADQRARSVAKGETLTDDWDVTWHGHHWAFEADSFDRTLAWVGDRGHPDDRLVALHRTFRTYAANGKPRQWIQRLKAAVAGDAVLEAVLQRLRRPPPSPSAKRWKATERKMNARQRQRDQRRRQSWEDFVKVVKANPDGVRHAPGVAPGRATTWQYHLSQTAQGGNRRTKRGQASDWRRLIPDFGEPVAEAYRDAALAHWRVYRPEIWSEGGSTRSIPFDVTFGLAGLEIEAEGGPDAWSRLDPQEVATALRYVFWELNGFPSWFKALFDAHPVEALEFVWTELRWELERAVGNEASFNNGLHDVVYHAPWLFNFLAPRLQTWLETHSPSDDGVLSYIRTILLGGGVQAEAVARLASVRLSDGAISVEQRATWIAYWIDADPEAGYAALEAAVTPMTDNAASDFVQAVLVHLSNGRGESGPGFFVFHTPAFLKRLYQFAHSHVRVSDDIERANRGVYSPTRRDYAQESRNALFNVLSEIPGEETYRALIELAEDHPDVDARPWMRSKARQRAMSDSDSEEWSPERLRALFAA